MSSMLKGKEKNLLNDDYLRHLSIENQFFKDNFSFYHNFIFCNFKTSLKKDYL